MQRSLSLACMLLLAALAQADQGNPKLKSIDAIRFGPNGMLIIGGGAEVVTVETGDTKETTWTTTSIDNVGELLAGKLGLKNRGAIKTGFAADLALFDPKTVRDEATFPDPHRHPVGIPYVVVNGQVVVDGPRYNAVPAGRVLTR